MKKLSLLAASVAVALTGCGGGDGSGSSSDNSSGNSGVTITAFDGYFKNAVMFIDGEHQSGTAGVLDNTDTILGLTDTKGQVNIGNIKIPDDATIAVQTIKPYDPNNPGVIDYLLSRDPIQFAGIYTVDMDLPGQAMEHEVVFRAPRESNVISPITDLVAIEMDKGASESDAITNVKTSLGVTDLDPFADFVAQANSGDQDAAVLHKTAQILTVTKATSIIEYQTNTADIANQAITVANFIAAENNLDINDPSIIATVDGKFDAQPETLISHKTIVNYEVFENIQDVFDGLNLELGNLGSNDYLINALDISKLFINAKNDIVIDSNNLFIDTSSLSGSNIDLGLGNPDGDKSKLYLGVSPTSSIAKAGDFEIILELRESNTADSKLVASARFELEVEEGEAKAPEVTSVLEQMKDTISQWDLTEGEEVNTDAAIYTVSYAGLFSSDNDLTIYVETNLHSNQLELHQSSSSQLIELLGTPKDSSEDNDIDYKIWFIAEDKDTSLTQTVAIDVPDIQSSPVQECKENDGYWYENQCNDEPQVAKFAPNHFEKSGDWVMGSFDYGDSEMALASLRMEGNDYLFCFAANDGNTTLSKQSWRNWLTDIKTDTIESDDCHSVDLNQDGTLTLGDDSQFSLVYEHVDVSENSTEYKLIFTTNDGELFWLDSDTADLTSFNSPIANNNIVEHFLIDDRTSYNEIEPMIDSLAYTVTSESDNGIPRSGTLGLESDHANQNFSGLWDVNQDSIGTTRLRFTDIDFGDGPEDISRLRYNYRDFGVLNIGIGDSDKNNGIGNQLGDHAFFYISSENKDELLKVYNAWVEANDD